MSQGPWFFIIFGFSVLCCCHCGCLHVQYHSMCIVVTTLVEILTETTTLDGIVPTVLLQILLMPMNMNFMFSGFSVARCYHCGYMHVHYQSRAEFEGIQRSYSIKRTELPSAFASVLNWVHSISCSDGFVLMASKALHCAMFVLHFCLNIFCNVWDMLLFHCGFLMEILLKRRICIRHSRSISRQIYKPILYSPIVSVGPLDGKFTD